MDLGLAGKVVIVTGSSAGIGLATAQEFGREGAHLVLCGRDAGRLHAAVGAMPVTAASVTEVTCDLLDPAGAAQLMKAAVARHGAIDILVNNIGGAVGGRLLSNSTDEEWRQTFEMNVVQTARLMRLGLPHMASRPDAAVVNVASISGIHPQLASSGQYAGAKAALIFDTERWALEFAPSGVRVNTVAPGAILVPGRGWGTYAETNPDDFNAYVRDAFPMGRLGHAAEVADAIVYLASRRSNWINGRTVPVDGLEQPVRTERHWSGKH